MADAPVAEWPRLSEKGYQRLSGSITSAGNAGPGGWDEPTTVRRYAIIASIALLLFRHGRSRQVEWEASEDLISRKDALEVGAIVEETEIDDLIEATDVADHTDIENVYGSPLQESYNHLDTFTSQLSRY